MGLPAYVWRVMLDGRPLPITIALEATGDEAHDAIQAIFRAAERKGMALEPVFPPDLRADTGATETGDGSSSTAAA